MTNIIFHTLKSGPSRSTMIVQIVEQLNGDQDVLQPGWENGSDQEILDLWSNLVEQTSVA